jgi:two-component system cell cycle sensor histidine kinase/response regulator CckA
MAAGGVLTLETRNVTLDAGAQGRFDGLQPGPHVVVAVSDTGTGMTDEVKSHLFEPFFTTKGIGRGTGLGLPTVYGIVKQSGGDVAVRSEPGRGSTFEVFLPRVEGEPERRAVEPDDQPTMGTETVLLVEDEDSLRDLMEEILPHYGYRVITAQDGNAALKVLERHDGPVHLVLTDVVMPGMNGKELHDRLRNLHPGVRVLFMSGYTDDHIAHHGILEPGTPFIQKPFSMTKLAGKLRQVLDAPPP